VSKQHDTYEQALIAVMEALEALADRAYATAKSLSPAVMGESYSDHRETMAVGTYVGTSDAYALVVGMISDYRKASA
jgi:hypothetical protein